MEYKDNIKKEDVKKKEKIFLGDDGILYIDISDTSEEKDIESMIDMLKEKLVALGSKRRILLTLTPRLGILTKMWNTYKLRKMLAEKTKNIFQDPGFEKAAIYTENITKRTVASFIIVAAGVSNVKVFRTKKEALEWLKKP